MLRHFQIVTLCLCGLLAFTSISLAQDFAVPPNASPEQMQQIMEAKAKMEARKAERGGSPSKDGEKPKDEKDKKPEEEKKGDEEKKEEAGNVKRPTEPKREPNPKELEIQPVDGLVSFQFNGQPWPSVIEWYGKVTGKSIDWRELPGDYLNLITRRKYTLEETGDLFNRHLLARGFTMLDDGDFLIIEKTEGINPGLVPRFAPEELASLMPNSFAKTSFPLSRMLAADTIKDLEPMKSKHGKLTALAATNRIEVMDTVKNLREMHKLLETEESSGRHSVEEFVLKHARAKDVLSKLESMLGVKKEAAGPMTPQQMQQMQQQQQQMQQQQQQNGGKPPTPETKQSPVKLVVNEPMNSILATAPRNKMLLIGELIERLDVASPLDNSLDAFASRNRTYRLSTLNPEMLVEFLMKQGGLDPSTSLTAEKKAKLIFASAPLVDHLRISRLIEQLDGSERTFKVIRLRRLGADMVATTVREMMGVKKEEDNNSRRNRYYYGWYGNQEEEDESSGEFMIAADVESNRLLMKCNEQEYEVVVDLLQQLGEITSPNQMNNQVRVIESVPGEDQDAFLKRVQDAFRAMGNDNPIVLPDPLPQEEPEDEGQDVGGETDDDNEDTVEGAKPKSSDPSRVVRAGAYATAFTQLRGPAVDTDVTDQPRLSRQQSEPIIIERDARGRLVLRSKDTKALDQFEQLMQQIAPKQPDYKVFTLKFASATWVSLKLEDYFEDEEDKPQNGYFYFWDPFDQEDEKPPGLGDRKKLKFISEIDTNTILVRNATPSQLQDIQELINLYDVAEPVNKSSMRYVKTFEIKYHKARSIENTLKEVFRDLLSGNDKAFEQKNSENKEGESRSRNRGGGGFYGGFGGGSGGDDSDTGSGKATFKGKISIGVNEETNMLIVTTEGEKLMDIVAKKIGELDQAAVPNDEIRVLTLETGTPSGLQQALTNMFGPGIVGTQANGDENKEGEKGEKPGQNNQPNIPGRNGGIATER